MIIVPAHTLWTLLGIWLAVVVCAFMFGWYARAYTRAEDQAQLKRAVRRHPSIRYQPDHLPRAGRLTVPPLVYDRFLAEDPPPLGQYWPALERTAEPVARWWPALERHAHADTAPFSHVEVSNWEANLRRKQDAWLHERGMQ